MKALTIYFLVIPWFAFSQQLYDHGFPIITNYPPNVYNAHAQVWCTEQNDSGLYFFGNSEGILVFDGSIWELISLPERNAVRKLKYKNDTTYVGGIGDLGYLTNNPDGTFNYTSLKNTLPENLREFGDIWKLEIHNDNVFYSAAQYLFVWNIPSKSFSIHYSKDSWHGLTVRENELYVADRNNGIFKYDEQKNELQLVSNTVSPLTGNTFHGTHKEDPWEILTSYTVIRYDGEGISKVRTPLDRLLEGTRVIGYLKINRGQSVLGTTKGAYVISESYNPLIALNTKTGIVGDESGNAYMDQLGRIWMGTFNGISALEMQEPIRIYDERNGLLGFVEDIIEVDGRIYVGTSNGIALLSDKGLFEYTKINDHTFKMAMYEDQVLVATSAGLAVISSATDEIEFVNQMYGRDVFISGNKALHATNSKGILVYEYDGQSWEYDSAFTSLTASISRYIFEDSKKNIWISDTRSKIFKISPDNQTYSFVEFGSDEGVPSGDIRFREIKEEFYIISDFGAFILNDAGKLKPHPGLRKFIGEQSVHDLFEDSVGNIFCVYGNTANMSIRQISITLDSAWIVPNKVSLIQNTSTWAHLVDSKGSIWFGGTKGLFVYNQDNDISEHIEPLLNVSVSQGSNVFKNMVYVQNQDLTSPFENNSIKYDYSILNFPHTQNQYRFRLVGFNEQWSAWTNAYSKEFNGLHEGDYQFEVQGKTATGVITPVYSSLFEILPPWYRSSLFRFFAGVILLLAVVWIVKYLSTRQLIKNLEVMKLKDKVQTERERISSDLHDHVGAQLSSLVSGLDMMELLDKKQLKKSDLVRSLRDDAKDSINNLRDTIWTLKKREITISDFCDRIEEYLDRYFRNSSLEIRVSKLIESNSFLNPEVSLNIMRAIQEMAHNTLKHAKATKFSVLVESQEDELIFKITDDGIGFETQSVNKDDQYGLSNIDQRIHRSGGTYDLKTAPGKGTDWLIRIKKSIISHGSVSSGAGQV